MNERTFSTFFSLKFSNRKCFLGGALTISIALTVPACTSSNSGANNANSEISSQSRNVGTKILLAIALDVPRYIEATGTFQADETSEVAAETSGKVSRTLVNKGDFVSTGDVIVQLDPRDAKLRLEQARSDEGRAKAQLAQAEAQLRQSQASLGLDSGGNFSIDNIPAVLQTRAALASRLSDLKLAETTERRYVNLLETGDTSRLVVDQRRNETERARAAVNEARENQKAAENTARQGNQAIAANRANVQNLLAAVKSAESVTALASKTVTDTAIHAPFSGFVSERTTSVGEYVSPTSTIVTVVRTNPIKVLLQIPEKEASNIKVGMSVSASIAAYTERNFAGHISAFNPLVNATSRSLQVEVIFENSENILRPGMFATARILQPGGDKGIYVARSGVFADAATNSLGVYVVEDGTARLRTVQIDESTRDAEDIRILSGVGEGERIAVTNVGQLFDGANVTHE